jgi:hypothetical protein
MDTKKKIMATLNGGEIAGIVIGCVLGAIVLLVMWIRYMAAQIIGVYEVREFPGISNRLGERGREVDVHVQHQFIDRRDLYIIAVENSRPVPNNTVLFDIDFSHVLQIKQMGLDVNMTIFVNGESIINLTELNVSVICHAVTLQVVALQKDDTLYYYHDRIGFIPFQYVGKHYNVCIDDHIRLSTEIYNHQLKQAIVHPNKTDTSRLQSVLWLHQFPRYYTLPGIHDRIYVPLIDPEYYKSFYVSPVFLPPQMIGVHLQPYTRHLQPEASTESLSTKE